MARLESGRIQFHLTEFELQPLLKECRQIMQCKDEESCVNISIVFPTDFSFIEADRDKIKQVVLNMVSNAIKYNVPNGSVMISADVGKTSGHLP
jgi:signal transduction histidine kinase